MSHNMLVIISLVILYIYMMQLCSVVWQSGLNNMKPKHHLLIESAKHVQE
jgi:hypothetical protein